MCISLVDIVQYTIKTVLFRKNKTSFKSRCRFILSFLQCNVVYQRIISLFTDTFYTILGKSRNNIYTYVILRADKLSK